jgi:hypothetical protein
MNAKLKKFFLALFASFPLLITPHAQAQIMWGVAAELGYIRGPGYPENPADSKTSLLGGLYVGTSGLEARPQVLISEGQYKGMLLDVGIRVTPKWFGIDEYLFGLVSPYGVLSGSVSYPVAWGWSAKAGLGVAIPPYGIARAEIGYRSHRWSPELLLEGVTISVNAGLPF